MPRSMPAVPAPHTNRWPAITIAALAIVLGGTILYSAGDALRPTPTVRVEPAVFIRVQAETPAPETARTEPVSRVTVQAPGWLEPDPYYTACTALAEGVVKAVHVLEGERVEKGQLVAELVDDDARLALAQADAALLAAHAELVSAVAEQTAAQTDWDSPVERERAVATARAALDETIAELTQLPSLISAERAMLERMSEDLSRLESAEKFNAASEFEVVIRQKDVARQAATLESVERRRAILDARSERLRAEVAAAERDFELRVSERRRLDDANARVARAEANVAQHSARRDEAALRYDRMTIEAPIAGFVQKRWKVPGDKIMFGMDTPHSAHVLHLYDPTKIQVRVDVPLADAAHVSVGQLCEVIVDVLPDTPFEGIVTRITHEADLQKNTLQVKVRVIDPPELLKPEMLTRVKFLPSTGGARTSDTEPSDAAVLVTRAALRDETDSSARVWAVRARRNGVGTAAAVTVTILDRTDNGVRVRGDLRPGDLLVVDETALSEGQRLRVANTDQIGGAS